VLLLELDSLLEGVLLVGVDYELRIRGINRPTVDSYLDARCGVWDATYTDDDFQQPATFPSRKSGRCIRLLGSTEQLVMIMVKS
jgi:hypothetical protein